MNAPEIWFAIPSADPRRCRQTLPTWREMGYRVAVLQNWARGEIPADRVVWAEEYPGWAESINILCREVVPKDAPIVVSGGDDMLPDPNHTAQELAEQFFERFPDGFGVMQPNGDAFMGAGHYCGSPWLGRRFIETMYRGAGPMFGEYRHNWADHELHWVARGLGALWRRDDLIQRHEHFTRTGEAPPEHWLANVAEADRRDVELFMARKWLDFPGHEPIGVDRVYHADAMRRADPRIAEAHWAGRYGAPTPNDEWASRLDAALTRCAEAGCRRVGIFGAGAFTRLAGAALMRPPVEIDCVIDEDPGLVGGRLWGFPVVDLPVAERMHLDAVVISANSYESHLRQRARPLDVRGVKVVSVWDNFQPTDPPLNNDQSDEPSASACAPAGETK